MSSTPDGRSSLSSQSQNWAKQMYLAFPPSGISTEGAVQADARVLSAIHDFRVTSPEPSRNGMPRNCWLPPGVRIRPSEARDRICARGPKSVAEALKYRVNSTGLKSAWSESAMAAVPATSSIGVAPTVLRKSLRRRSS